MPFWLAGYPNVQGSINRMKVLLRHCDILEVGIPFLDPSADGPVIQNASKIAIKMDLIQKTSLLLHRARKKENPMPIVILCYLNTILQYGIDEFFHDAKNVNVSGVLIPDLPPEESIFSKKRNNKT